MDDLVVDELGRYVSGDWVIDSVDGTTVAALRSGTQEILGYISEDISDVEAKSIGTRMANLENVYFLKFVSREEALENFISAYEDVSAFEGVEAEDLRHRYVIQVEDPHLIEETAEALRALSGVDKVVWVPEFVRWVIPAESEGEALELLEKILAEGTDRNRKNSK